MVSPNGLPIVKVDRTTVFGNPYRVGIHADTAEDVVELLRFAISLCQDGVELFEDDPAIIKVRRMLVELPSLRGKNLACWCKRPEHGEPDVCHAALLIDLANKDSDAKND